MGIDNLTWSLLSRTQLSNSFFLTKNSLYNIAKIYFYETIVWEKPTYHFQIFKLNPNKNIQAKFEITALWETQCGTFWWLEEPFLFICVIQILSDGYNLSPTTKNNLVYCWISATLISDFMIGAIKTRCVKLVTNLGEVTYALYKIARGVQRHIDLIRPTF